MEIVGERDKQRLRQDNQRILEKIVKRQKTFGLRWRMMNDPITPYGAGDGLIIITMKSSSIIPTFGSFWDP